MNGNILPVAVALAISLSAVAQPCPHGKRGKLVEPWEMTDAERAARRVDTLDSALRRARAIADGESGIGDEMDVFILGRHNPELVMGYELMDMLAVVYTPETEPSRKFRPNWVPEGKKRFGDDFWERFRAIASSFIDEENSAMRRMRRRATSNETPPANGMSSNDRCRLRAQALAAARETFGRKRFDAFLYEVIAPDAGPRATSMSRPDPTGELFLWVEGGCQ